MALQNGLDQDQANTRRPGTFYDDHTSQRFPKGRPWFSNIDKRSGAPVGLMRPKGWSAPWLPDPTSFKYSEDEPNRFTIDYESILNERLSDHAAYQTMKEAAAVARGWDPTLPEKQAVLEALVGKPPLPVEPIAAAMQGNSWMLGLTDRVDPRLEPFVRKETRRQKMLKSLPDFSDSLSAIETQAAEVEAEPTDWDDELDKLLDVEEQVDPQATGGKKVNPKKTTKV